MYADLSYEDYDIESMNMKRQFLLMIVAACLTAGAQTITMKDTVMTTYPFGDPNPIPQVKRNCYPYCNFEQFATTPVQQTWKLIMDSTRKNS